MTDIEIEKIAREIGDYLSPSEVCVGKTDSHFITLTEGTNNFKVYQAETSDYIGLWDSAYKAFKAARILENSSP